MTRIEVLGSQLQAGDVIADSDGGDRYTVSAVQVLGPVLIIDRADGTATPPISDGKVVVLRG